MQGHGKEIVLACPVDAEVIGAVEHHIAPPGAAGEVERRSISHVGIGRHRRQGDATIAKAGVSLDGTTRPQRLSAIGDEADIDVGINGPGLKRPQDFLLPGAGGGAAVERLKERALGVAAGCPVRNETQGQMTRVRPRNAPRGRREAVFQDFQAELA